MSLPPKCSILLATLAVVGVSSAFAARPGGGGGTTPPPPAGTILFDTTVNPGTDPWHLEARGINADGTGSKLAFTHQILEPRPVPSARVYGSDPVAGRIWLALDKVDVVIDGTTYNATELFAYRVNAGSLERIQLTALFPYVTFFPQSYCTRASWSNDGADSFLSLYGVTYGAETALTPPEQRNPGDDLRHIFRLNINGNFLQAAFDSQTDPKFDIADLNGGLWIESVLSAVPDFTNAYTLAYHCWSPDGTQLAYVMPDGLWVTTLDPNGPVLHGSVPATFLWQSVSSAPQWSPDGQRIAFGDQGSIRTIKPDGTDPRLVLPAASNDRYEFPVWSPDSQHLAIRHRRIKGFDWLYDVQRVPAGGGSVTTLYKGDVYGDKIPQGWHLNLAP